MRPATVIEVATGKVAEVLSGADGSAGLVLYRYVGEKYVRTTTREAFFLCGYFVAAPEASTSIT